jgi:hypothetical protein
MTSKIHYRIHKSPPLNPNLIQVNQIHNFLFPSLFISWWRQLRLLQLHTLISSFPKSASVSASVRLEL